MRVFLIAVLLSFTTSHHAQNWAAVGGGFDDDVRCLYADTIADRLYAGGNFWNSDVVVRGVSILDNQQWDSLAGGTTLCVSSGCNPVVSLCQYNGDIFAGGFFFGMQGAPNSEAIAKWNGISWQSVGDANGVVLSLAVYNNDLYAAGNFDSIGNIEAFNIARFDGTNWFPVADTTFKNTPISCATVYQGSLYVGGTFHNPSVGIHCIARYNGSSWSSPGVSPFTSGMCGINVMEVYQNKLYVGGYFSMAVGAPGHGIAQWDGATWGDVGGGLEDTLGYPANVFALCVHNNKLVAGGTFRYAGGAYACNIAQWDGNVWCGFGSQFNSGIGALESFADTLYVGGGFSSIDGDPQYDHVAKWVGGNFVDTCGNSTGVYDLCDQKSVISFPNPASETVTVQFSNSHQSRSIIIYDQLGREVLLEETNENLISFSVQEFAEGIYFYSVLDEKGTSTTGKFVVTH